MSVCRKKIRLSFLIAKTQKMFLWALSSFVLILFFAYLFGMNQVAMQGYVLTRETQKNAELSATLEQIDAQIARLQTREYITKSSDSLFMVPREYQRFSVVKQTFTAQR